MNSAAVKKNINLLTLDEQKQLAKLTYEKRNYFSENFSEDRVEFDYAFYAKAFRAQIERLLSEKKIVSHLTSLETLHEQLSEEIKAYNFTDGVNKVSTYFYETDQEFMELYNSFIRTIHEDIVREDFLFQAIPTIRIHCPNAINANLYPRYHTDICYGHPDEEINIWFPLTEVQEGHGFRMMGLDRSKETIAEFDYDYAAFIESATKDREFSNYCDTLADPVLTEFGKVLFFDPRCVHSGEPLKAHTRISFDTRVIVRSRFEKMDLEYQGSGRRKILFSPGHCYHEKSIKELG